MYFIAYVVVVYIDIPLKQVLHMPDLVGWLTKCSVNMFEFDVSFGPMKAPKGQWFEIFIT